MVEKQKVSDYLERLNISFEVHEHKPVRTVEEALTVWASISGSHFKNLFFRDQKGKQHFLVILEHSKQLDIQRLSAHIGNQKLSFASERRLQKYLGLQPGTVSPFGLLNDKENHVHVFLDKSVQSAEQVNFHPNVNTATLTLSATDFEKFLDSSGNKYSIINI